MTVKKILLVEDEAIITMVTANTLKRFGYQVQVARSGEEAIQIALEEGGPDLILMDIDLGNGTEAARIILQKQELPVVFHSAHTEKEIVDKTEEITSYGYIVKNSAPTVLQASIKMAFRLFDARMELKDREQHYRSLFDDAVGPVFIEDFSFVKQRFNQLMAEGDITDPSDFSLWLEKHPEELDSFESKVIIEAVP
jgi:CheY-like chemotaxis protein